MLLVNFQNILRKVSGLLTMGVLSAQSYVSALWGFLYAS